MQGPAVRAFQDAVRRRSVGREPVAYITGVKGFRHLDLHVDPRVLIPRPETETLVEAALDAAAVRARGRRRHRQRRGGAGAQGRAPGPRGDGDRRQRGRAGRGARQRGAAGARRRASCAPTCSTAWARSTRWSPTRPTSRTARRWRPRSCATSPPRRSTPGSTGWRWCAGWWRRPASAAPPSSPLEVGAGQALAVEELARAAGFARTERRADLAGIDRVVAAWR